MGWESQLRFPYGGCDAARTSETNGGAQWVHCKLVIASGAVTHVDWLRWLLQLSGALRANLGTFTPKRVSVVSKYIEVLDTIPSLYRAAEVVYLSNNSLTSLEGLSQFRALRTLSLSNNLVEDPEQLRVLAAACPSLTTLSLEGNPIAAHPRYRALVLQHLPWLHILDGLVRDRHPRCSIERGRAQCPQSCSADGVQVVTAAELSGTDVALRRHTHTMRMLFANDCRIRQLQMLGRILGVHRQLRRAVFGGVGRQVSIGPIPASVWPWPLTTRFSPLSYPQYLSRA